MCINFPFNHKIYSETEEQYVMSEENSHYLQLVSDECREVLPGLRTVVLH